MNFPSLEGSLLRGRFLKEYEGLLKDLFDRGSDGLSATHLQSIQRSVRYGKGEKGLLPTTTPETRIERVVEVSRALLENMALLRSAERVELTT